MDIANSIVTDEPGKETCRKCKQQIPKSTVKTTKQAIQNKETKTKSKKQQKDQMKPKGHAILEYIRGTTERLIKIYKS